MKAIVVTPTYNERENIEPFILEVLASHADIHIMIVDDNSPDGTGQIVQKMSAENERIFYLGRKGKRGRGLADREGSKRAVQLGFDVVMQMDADFSHLPKYIPDFLEAIEQYDVVIGSRLVKGGAMKGRSMLRTMTTYLANFYIRIFWWLPARDCTSGFRCYRRKVLESIPLEGFISSGPSILEEILFACHERGFSIGEIPITFYDRTKGNSKLTMKDLVHILVLVVQFRLVRQK